MWRFGLLVNLMWLPVLSQAQAEVVTFPQAQRGVMDLRAWDFEAQGSVPILGELSFRWLEYLPPQTPDLRTWDYRIPSWQGGFPGTPYGYGTYKLVLELPDANTLYALRLGEIDTAYRLWIDGELRAEVGDAGVSDATTSARYRPKVVAFQSDDTSVEVLVQIANFRYPTALLRSSDGAVNAKLRVGTFEQLRNAQTNSTFRQLFLYGVLAAMSLYHIAIFIQRRKLLVFLYFGIFCLLLLVRDSVNGEVLLSLIFPDLSFEWQLGLDYGAAYAIGPFFLLYMRTLFPDEVRGIIFRTLCWVFVPFVGITIAFPAAVFIGTLPAFLIAALLTLAYVLVCVVLVVWRKRAGANYILLGIISVTLAILLDTLFLFDVTDIGGFWSWGFLVFIASQALLLSRRNGNAYERLEHLSSELEASNNQLEARVLERTEELSTRSHELEQASAHIAELNKQLTAENRRMGSELDVTRRLQELLLPADSELEAVTSLDMAGINVSAHEVGGDYYDVLSLHDPVTTRKQVFIGIGDVTGHGLESGMLMLMTQMGVRALLDAGEHNPASLLTVLNRSLHANIARMDADKSLTLALLAYEHQDGVGYVQVSGQHEDLLVIRADGQVELYDTFDLGFPLGLEEDISAFAAQQDISLNPGDGVLLYTDGITEAPSPEGELYGLKRLTTIASEYWQHPAQLILKLIMNDVNNHLIGNTDLHLTATPIHDRELEDDITLLVIKQGDV
ncbi:MAG: SpoIIE family protein phosphatase [Deinococcota bacterium]